MIERPVFNPATGEIIARVMDADIDEVQACVQRARQAFDYGPWSCMSVRDRARILRKIGSLIESRADEIADVETKNSGKTIRDSKTQVLKGAACFDYYAGLADKIWGQAIPMENDLFAYTAREPLGVCLGVMPWNSPFIMAVYKSAPALAAGNAVILKPASATPLTAMMLGDICTGAGVPDGVVNVIVGSGETIGTALVRHPGVDKVSLTGSNATGAAIMSLAAPTAKKLTLELGGKSPNIVFADADLNKAIPGSVTAIFSHAGQRCTARSRFLVHESIYEEFVRQFVEQTKALRVGDPLDPATDIGPLISKAQKDLVLNYIKSGQASGARMLCGGEPDSPELSRGHYVMPTVFVDVAGDDAMAQEEIFGPVVCIFKFRDEANAIRMANDTIFGLAATVWTRDLARAHRVAKCLRAGVISINSVAVTYIEAPFGGYKQSGIGRELGLEGLLQYCETKSVFVDTAS